MAQANISHSSWYETYLQWTFFLRALKQVRILKVNGVIIEFPALQLLHPCPE